MSTVLVTGGSGFIGTDCIVQLLAAGHLVRTTVRDLAREEDELIVPAREGALRVLRASREAGVKRVVLTSSFAAVGYAQKSQKVPFND